MNTKDSVIFTKQLFHVQCDSLTVLPDAFCGYHYLHNPATTEV